MPNYDDYEDIITTFNFTNATALPDNYITPDGEGRYTLSYNFLTDQNSVTLTGDYDVLEVGEEDIPQNQNLEYDTFSSLTSSQEDSAQIIMHEKREKYCNGRAG